LFRKESSEITKNTLICLAGFCAGAYEYQIEKRLDFGCVKHVLIFLDNNPKQDWKIVDWALRIIGSLSDQQYLKLLDFGLVEKIEDLLEHDEKEMRKTAAWALSNILVSGKECTEAVFEYREGKIIRRLFQMIRTDDLNVKMLKFSLSYSRK